MRTFDSTYAPDAFLGVDAAGNAYLPGGTDGAALVKVGPMARRSPAGPAPTPLPDSPTPSAASWWTRQTGDVWLTDMTTDQVVRLSATWSRRTAGGRPATARGSLTQPTGIALDGKGHVLVVDTGNNRVETFRPDGTFVRELAMPPG